MGFIPEGCPSGLWMWAGHWTQGPQPLSTLTMPSGCHVHGLCQTPNINSEGHLGSRVGSARVALGLGRQVM